MSGANNPKIKVALHIHTLYSPCGETKLEDIGEYCRSHNINVIAITDHNTIAGALCLRALAPDLRIIVGEEIQTRQGEVIGLFLEHEIEPYLDVAETCERIRSQRGLIYVPHPFDLFKIHRLRKRALMQILDMVDIIEVFNAKSLNIFNQQAAHFAERYAKIGAVGSDAHCLDDIDACLNEMEDFSSPSEFLESLRNARFIK